LLSGATPSCFCSHIRASDEAAAALNSHYVCSTPAVHSGSSRDADDTLSAKAVLTSLSNTSSHIEPPSLVYSVNPVCFPEVTCRQTSGDPSKVLIHQLSSLHYFWHERSALIVPSQLKSCRNQWVTVEPTNICSRCIRANLCDGRKFSWCTVHWYNTVATEASRCHL